VAAAVRRDHLATADGRVFGLMNLESVCDGYCEEQWPEVVDAHFAALLEAFPGAPPELGPDQIRDGVHARLVLADPHSPAVDYAYARRLGTDLIGLLAHVTGSMVRWLTDEEVALVGADELWSLGLGRVDRIRPQDCELIDTRAGAFCTLRGRSGFIASKALVLAETVGLLLGPDFDPDEGLLVGVPTRHELAFMPTWATAAGRDAFSTYTAQEFANGVAPLSPHVYRWGDGQFDRLA
jgi:hypothetical protein